MSERDPMRAPRPRPRRRKLTASPPGASPGTLIVGAQARPPAITVMRYGERDFAETAVTGPEDLAEWLRGEGVVWISVTGLGDTRILQEVADLIGMHPLALEDAVNPRHRPKVEDYADYLFIVARAVAEGPDADQVSLFVRAKLLVSFEEGANQPFAAVRKRLRDGKGKIRARGADYLAYALIDALVDACFPLLEEYGEVLERLEDHCIERPIPTTVRSIHDIRREFMLLRQVVWPSREMVNHLLREGTPVITVETRTYLRDVYDHVVQQLEILESYRESASNLMEVYLTTISNRMNEIMKVLTVIATIFIPLTFIVGLYGMNFDTHASPWNMPELRWYWGYPACLSLMAVVGGGLLFYFWRRGWIGGRSDRAVDRT
jgi:magnesium transporter